MTQILIIFNNLNTVKFTFLCLLVFFLVYINSLEWDKNKKKAACWPLRPSANRLTFFFSSWKQNEQQMRVGDLPRTAVKQQQPFPCYWFDPRSKRSGVKELVQHEAVLSGRGVTRSANAGPSDRPIPPEFPQTAAAGRGLSGGNAAVCVGICGCLHSFTCASGPPEHRALVLFRAAVCVFPLTS